MKKATIQPSLTTDNPTDLELNKWSWELTTTSDTEANKNWKATGLTSDNIAEQRDPQNFILQGNRKGYTNILQTLENEWACKKWQETMSCQELRESSNSGR